MARLQVETRGRWFLTHQLWELANAEEIRAQARKLNVRLVDAVYRAPNEPEAEGKPEEILIKKVTADHSDSGQPSQSEADKAKAAEEAKAKALAEAKAAEDKAKAEAEAKAKAEAEEDAALKAKVAEKAAKAAAAKAEKEAAADSAE